MSHLYDVIVVGAGPAGSTAAYEMATAGMDVLLIDKATFPRPKCCGGGVTVKASQFVGDVLAEAGLRTIRNATFKAGSSSFRGLQDKTVITMVDRARFDHLLVQRASTAGVHFLSGKPVDSIALDSNQVRVTAGGEEYCSKFLVGADGAKSIVARTLGLNSSYGFVGIETEVSVGKEDMASWDKTILVDLGWTSKGYGWLFPKSDYFSLGIGCLVGSTTNLKKKYWQFVNSLQLKDLKVNSWSAGFIPMYARRPKVAQGRIALVGDAAALADPLTGEGIGNAVLSGHLASESIKTSVSQNLSHVDSYQQAVDHFITPEIDSARFLSRIIFKMPGKMLDFARRDGRLWNAGCALVRGETTYAAIKGRVGSIGGLYSILRGKSLSG